MSKIKIDGVEYERETLPENVKELLIRNQKLHELIEEKTNLLAVLTKAKRSYISDLKSEIISAKAGTDFIV